MEEKPSAVVIGGVNVDLCGVPDKAFLTGDSNPGRVTVTAGGVGRNIAENLSRMGVSVRMVTALGDDAHAAFVRESCARSGIDLSHSITVSGAKTSTYLCLSDEKGDLIGAVSDMAICDELTPDVMESRLGMMNEASLVVLDGNLPKQTVTWLCQRLRVPVFADPVSVRKAGVFASSLPKIKLMKPNRSEASLLCGVEIHSHADLPLAAEAFFASGLHHVIISLGGEGVYYHDGRDSGILPCFSTPIVNTTGCGDAFLASAAAAYLEGMSLRDMALHGLAASAICAQTDSAVNPNITMDAVKALVQTYHA